MMLRIIPTKDRACLPILSLTDSDHPDFILLFIRLPLTEWAGDAIGEHAKANIRRPSVIGDRARKRVGYGLISGALDDQDGRSGLASHGCPYDSGDLNGLS
jgi:hypothetical protein